MSASVFELQGSISMDSSGFEKAVKDAIAEGKNLVKALGENTAQMKALQDSVDKAKEELDRAKKSMQETADSAEDMTKEVNKSADATGDMAKEVEGLKSDLAKAEKAVEDTADETKKLAERMDKAEGETKDLKEQVDKLDKQYENTEKETKDLDNDTEKLGDTVEKTEGKFAKLADFLKTGLKTAITVGVGAIVAAGTAIAGYTKSAFDAYSEYEQLAGAVTSMYEGESATKILDNAKKSYESAGTSALEYLSAFSELQGFIANAAGRGEQTDVDALKEQLDEEYQATKRALQDKYDANKEYWDDVISLADKSQKDGLRKSRDADLKALKRTNEDELAELKAHNKDVLAEAERANQQSTRTVESEMRTAELFEVVNQDIADLVNKNAVEYERAVDTYKSLAKGEYKLLDNLKLGYGQTQSEMERLIADAKDYTGIEYDIDNYADVIEAIHAIVEMQGIAGATADEQKNTVEGSTKAMAAAWQNLKLAIAGGDMEEIEENINGLITGSEYFIKNSVPVITRILTSLGETLPKVADVIAQEAPKLITDILPSMVKATTGLISGVVKALPNVVKALTNKTTVNTILIAFQDMLSAIMDGVVVLFEEAPDIIPDLLNQVGNALINSVDIIGNAIIQMIPEIERLLYKAEPVLMGVISGLMTTIAALSEKLLPDLLPDLVELVADLLTGIMDADYAAQLHIAVITIATALLTAFNNSQEPFLDALSEIATTLFEDFLPELIEEHGDDIADAMIELFKTATTTFIQTNPLLEMITYIGGEIGTLISDAFTWGQDLIDSFLDGITAKKIDLSATVGEVAGTIASYIHFSEPDKGALADFHTFAPDMMNLFAQGIRDNADEVYREVARLTEGISTDLNAGVSVESTGGATAVSTGGVYIYNTFSLEGVKIASDVDIEEMSDKAIQMISEKLEQLRIFDTRAYGGVVMP